MDVGARPAEASDHAVLVDLYRKMEAEQVALKPMWRLADGLPEPAEAALEAAIADEGTIVVIGEIEGVPFGFAIAGTDPLLPQADGEQVGVVRYIFTDHEAREVGVAEAMAQHILSELQGRGLRRFDVRVLPGHRNAKNFFEANGFSARLIVMHRDDTR